MRRAIVAVSPAPHAVPDPTKTVATAPWDVAATASSRIGRHLLAFVAFAAPAVVLWWHAWDGHLSSTLACACGDSGQAVWFVAWPAYALAHGLDPFFSSAVQAPKGVNLLTNASSVPVGIVLAPVTWAAGPVVATNVALTLCPAVSAWGCWVACRRFTSWSPAALVAGALFGYSPFVVSNLELGHIGLTLLVVPPLLLLGARRVLFGPRLHRMWWGVAIGALLALQYLISSEIFVICIVVGGPCGVVAALVRIRALPPPRELLAALGAAGGTAIGLLALPVWIFVAGPEHLTGPLWPGASIKGNDLYAFWSPGSYRAPGSVVLQFGGYEGLRGPPSAYLGAAVLAVGLASLVVAWRRRTAWLLALGAAVSAALSLGVWLWVAPGHVVNVWLPWRFLGTWPFLDDVIPQRFSAVTDLLVALLVAVGLDRIVGHRSGLVRRWALAAAPLVAAVALVSLWWTYQIPFATRDVSLPAWYADAAPLLAKGSVVLSYPFPFPRDGSSAPMVWQAVDGMRFRLAGGYVKAPGRDGRPLSDAPTTPACELLARLTARAAGPLPRVGVSEVRVLRHALVRWQVDEVVVTGHGRDPHLAVRTFQRVVGSAPRHVDGAWVWSLGATH